MFRLTLFSLSLCAGLLVGAVPCEVQGQTPVVAPKCVTCGTKCQCVACGCPKAEADVLARKTTLRAAVLAAEIRIPMYDGYGREAGSRSVTVRQYVAEGGDLDAVRGMPEDHKAAVRGVADRPPVVVVSDPIPVQTFVVHPVAQPMPVRFAPVRPFQAGFQFNGPFGGGFGAGACVGGT